MKYNKEIIDWFNNYFYNCYYVKHDDFPESIFMFYDKNYVRQLKLAKLDGKNIKKTDITGICIFQQDWKNKWFRCNYDLIWCYLKNNYSFNYGDFQSFITDRLEEHSKMNVLTSEVDIAVGILSLEEHSKMNVLTSTYFKAYLKCELEEHSKMNVLTSNHIDAIYSGELEEHSKMNVLTSWNELFSNNIKLEEHSKMNVLTSSR